MLSQILLTIFIACAILIGVVCTVKYCCDYCMMGTEWSSIAINILIAIIIAIVATLMFVAIWSSPELCQVC